MEFYDRPFSWECHHPNSFIFFRGVGQPPSSQQVDRPGVGGPSWALAECFAILRMGGGV